MDRVKLQTVINAFILSQFSYCPVIWMLHDGNVNNKINEFINSTIVKCFEVALLSFLREYCCTLSMEACLIRVFLSETGL